MTYSSKTMSVRRVQNEGGERKGGVAGRLAAVLSIGAQGGDDDRKRQRTSLFEYGTEYKGTVRGEAEVFRHHASLSIASEPRIHYYVEMDGVDEKFYFYNVKEQHGIRSIGLTYTSKQTSRNNVPFHRRHGDVLEHAWAGPSLHRAQGCCSSPFRPLVQSDWRVDG